MRSGYDILLLSQDVPRNNIKSRDIIITSHLEMGMA